MSIKRVDRTSERIRALLNEVAPEVVAAAEDAFERVIFVPVSAIGTSPVMDPASGLLPLVYAHLFSLDLVRDIFGRQVQLGKGPIEAPQIVATPA